MIIKIGNKKLNIKDFRGIKSVKGLMFSQMKNMDGALIYGNSIWMPFVKHQLDLAFLDKNNKIIDVQRAVPMTLELATWRVYKCRKAKMCLELKADTIKLKKGMKMQIIKKWV